MNDASLNWVYIVCSKMTPNNIAIQAGEEEVFREFNTIINNGLIVLKFLIWGGLFKNSILATK